RIAPAMNLRLQFPPTPEHAAKHAQQAVDAAWKVEHIKLDYSPESLVDVDRILGRFHADKLGPEQIGSTGFSFCCYVGEGFVRHNGAVWKMLSDANLPDFLKEDNTMMVVEMPDGVVWNPIGKAFKLLENGEADSVAYFYQVAVDQNGSERDDS